MKQVFVNVFPLQFGWCISSIAVNPF